jgi:hypothetical protein
MREAPLPAAEAKKRYLIYLAVRLTGLAVVLLGGCSLFVRPKHLGLTRK